MNTGAADSKRLDAPSDEPDPTRYDAMRATLRTIGDRQSLSILWAALHGVSRFKALQRRLGITREVLSSRLDRLVYAGLLRNQALVQEDHELEYIPTERGEALRPALEGMVRWQAEQASVRGVRNAEHDRSGAPQFQRDGEDSDCRGA